MLCIVFAHSLLIQSPEIEVHQVREVCSHKDLVVFLLADWISSKVEGAQVFKLSKVYYLKVGLDMWLNSSSKSPKLSLEIYTMRTTVLR